MAKKRNEELEEWNKVQRGLDPGETTADRVLGNLHTQRAGWHRTRGRYADNCSWKPRDREDPIGWLYTPEVVNHQSAINPVTNLPEISPEQRAAEDAWEQRSISMHKAQRADTDSWLRSDPISQGLSVDDETDPDPYKPRNVNGSEPTAYHDLPASERAKDRQPPLLKRGD